MSDKPENIIFTDHYAPVLNPGEYTIVARQNVGENGGVAALTQKFHVRGPQFTLDATDVYTQYPAQGATDDFADQLPYVVLSKRTLPWQRTLPGNAGDPIPWMALLVFSEEEVSPTITLSIEDYLKPSRREGEAVIEAIVPVNAADLGVDKTSYCQCIEITLETFASIAPRLEELPYLAHGRKVEMTQKAETNMPHQGDFSIVMANRFPAPDEKNVVHLVSLQGCETYLGGAGDPNKLIRLVSLCNWSFQCAKGEDSFRDIVENLVKTNGKEQRLLRLPSGQINHPAIAGRLEQGYVPLPFRLMDGTDTLAWYRGPFTPAEAATGEARPEHHATASAALGLDSATGMFDQSNATAWQLGRLLALEDPTFGPKLMELRRKIHVELDLFLQRFAQASQQPGEAFSAAEGHALALEVMKFDALSGLSQVMNEDTAGSILEGLDTPLGESSLVASANEGDIFDSSIPETYTGLYQAFVNNLREGKAAVEVSEAADPASRALQEIDYPKFTAHLLGKFADELNDIIAWLKDLDIRDIPFYYALPHPRLLPAESIRFFMVDDRWWHSVHDGALSIGIHSGIDEAVWKLLSAHLLDPEKGKQISGFAASDPTDDKGDYGLLLRSRLLRAWKGVEFRAFIQGEPVTPHSARNLGSDVLMMLFEKMPDELWIELPREGLCFAASGRTLSLKYTNETQAGKAIPEVNVAVPVRTGGNVIDVKTLVAEMQTRTGQSLKSASFALQWIRQSERFILKWK